MIWRSPTRTSAESRGSQLPGRLQGDEVGAAQQMSGPDQRHLSIFKWNGHFGFAAISWHALDLLPPQPASSSSPAWESSHLCQCAVFVAFLPPFPSAPSLSEGRGCRLSSGRTLCVHMLSLGRAVTSPAASRSQTRQGREEKLEWGRGLQAFHSSNRINLIYRHSKMQLKRELK